MNNWYILTGGPSTGKSTLLNELAKLGHTTVLESARTIIDEALSKGKSLNDIRSDEIKFLYDVLDHRYKVEKEYSKNSLIFFDRGLHDVLAFFRFRKVKPDPKSLKLMKNNAYRKVFLLDHLDNYEKDYSRTETEEDSREISKQLHRTYSEYGMSPIIVPVLPPKERAEFVLQHIG